MCESGDIAIYIAIYTLSLSTSRGAAAPRTPCSGGLPPPTVVTTATRWHEVVVAVVVVAVATVVVVSGKGGEQRWREVSTDQG